MHVLLVTLYSIEFEAFEDTDIYSATLAVCGSFVKPQRSLSPWRASASVSFAHGLRVPLSL
jgi:hypothetical protein